MSRQQMCPCCGQVTEHADLGNIQGRHVFRCKPIEFHESIEGFIRSINGNKPGGCGGLWEEIVVQQPIKKGDPIRKVLV